METMQVGDHFSDDQEMVDTDMEYANDGSVPLNSSDGVKKASLSIGRQTSMMDTENEENTAILDTTQYQEDKIEILTIKSVNSNKSSENQTVSVKKMKNTGTLVDNGQSGDVADDQIFSLAEDSTNYITETPINQKIENSPNPSTEDSTNLSTESSHQSTKNSQPSTESSTILSTETSQPSTESSTILNTETSQPSTESSTILSTETSQPSTESPTILSTENCTHRKDEISTNLCTENSTNHNTVNSTNPSTENSSNHNTEISSNISPGNCTYHSKINSYNPETDDSNRLAEENPANSASPELSSNQAERSLPSDITNGAAEELDDVDSGEISENNFDNDNTLLGGKPIKDIIDSLLNQIESNLKQNTSERTLKPISDESIENHNNIELLVLPIPKLSLGILAQERIPLQEKEKINCVPLSPASYCSDSELYTFFPDPPIAPDLSIYDDDGPSSPLSYCSDDEDTGGLFRYHFREEIKKSSTCTNLPKGMKAPSISERSVSPLSCCSDDNVYGHAMSDESKRLLVRNPKYLSIDLQKVNQRKVKKKISYGTYKCSFCNRAFYDKNKCWRHERFHAMDLIATCRICGTGVIPSRLGFHMTTAHGGLPTDVSALEVATSSPLVASTTTSTTTSTPVASVPDDDNLYTNMLECPICSRKFKRLKTHMTAMHADQLEDDDPILDPDEMTVDAKDEDEHNDSMDEILPTYPKTKPRTECDICHLSFKNLRLHKLKKHGITSDKTAAHITEHNESPALSSLSASSPDYTRKRKREGEGDIPEVKRARNLNRSESARLPPETSKRTPGEVIERVSTELSDRSGSHRGVDHIGTSREHSLSFSSIRTDTLKTNDIEHLDCPDDSNREIYPCDHCSRVYNNAPALKLHSIVHTTRKCCPVCKGSYPNMASHLEENCAVVFLEQSLITAEDRSQSYARRSNTISMTRGSGDLLQEGIDKAKSLKISKYKFRFQCDRCPRSYKNSNLLQNHELTYHQTVATTKRTCDICKVSFSDQKRLDTHQIDKHRCNVKINRSRERFPKRLRGPKSARDRKLIDSFLIAQTKPKSVAGPECDQTKLMKSLHEESDTDEQVSESSLIVKTMPMRLSGPKSARNRTNLYSSDGESTCDEQGSDSTLIVKTKPKRLAGPKSARTRMNLYSSDVESDSVEDNGESTLPAKQKPKRLSGPKSAQTCTQSSDVEIDEQDSEYVSDFESDLEKGPNQSHDSSRDQLPYCDSKTSPKTASYECMACDKVYSRENLLIIHVRTHTGEKPFECDICERSFSSKAGLCHHKAVTHRS